MYYENKMKFKKFASKFVVFQLLQLCSRSDACSTIVVQEINETMLFCNCDLWIVKWRRRDINCDLQNRGVVVIFIYQMDYKLTILLNPKHLYWCCAHLNMYHHLLLCRTCFLLAWIRLFDSVNFFRKLSPTETITWV